MKKYIYIVLILFFVPFSLKSYSQGTGGVPDSLRIQNRKEAGTGQERQNQNIRNQEGQGGTQAQSQNMNQNRSQARPPGTGTQQGNAARNGSDQGIKQVKSARPDMSKARGARPPSIVRPSGSQIPKGIGKPGGAMKRGGR